LLDGCRHFFEKDVVLKYIDLLAYYKMNILHLHLTEDQGWRIQIDKYPETQRKFLPGEKIPLKICMEDFTQKMISKKLSPMQKKDI